MDKAQLVEIANTEMPFGKYKGRRLIDVPEEYYCGSRVRINSLPGILAS
ncbi:putative negative regulator [Klebsiella pneumoniae]|uniref:Putative negative regulator n=1 Tax=Klebsiella pneumoniae TaxID=573 RepID=A0A377XBN3_KLEPN|nr:putative negative regulator [Klebsiella pneumoniae]